MECVIDTNVLVDYILIDSEMHNKAKSGLEKIVNGFVPSVVLEELVSVLARLGFDKKTISEKLKEVLESYEVLSLYEGHISEAEEMVMAEEKVSFKRFNDMLILFAAKQKNVPLFTFDKNLNEECEHYGVKPFTNQL